MVDFPAMPLWTDADLYETVKAVHGHVVYSKEVRGMKIDEQGLPVRRTIDEAAYQDAIDVMFKPGWTLRAALEAYEAARPELALWRPIEEMPLGLPVILALPTSISLPQTMANDLAYRIVVKYETGIWDQTTGHKYDEEFLDDAMYRTITPPPASDGDAG